MCWLEDLLEFWFPAPVDGAEDSKLPTENSKSHVRRLPPAPVDIPEWLRAEPAVREAERVVRSRR
jgi:hypothetical protein